MTARETQYGKYREAYGAWFDPRWITDLELSFQATAAAAITVGADNVFDIRPDRSAVAFYPSLGESYSGAMSASPSLRPESWL